MGGWYYTTYNCNTDNLPGHCWVDPPLSVVLSYPSQTKKSEYTHVYIYIYILKAGTKKINTVQYNYLN